jgi:predicted DNA-binding transcriptional regulator YafY
MSKDYLTRKRVINECLTSRQKPYPTFEEIKMRCEEALDKPISRSTIEKDFQAVEREYGVDIRYSQRHKGYYYDDEHFSTENFGLSTEDLNSIEYGAALLYQYRKLPVLQQHSAAIDKILRTVRFRKTYGQQGFQDFIHLETVPETKGTEFLDKLLTATKERMVVDVIYHRYFSPESKQYAVHPYLLKESHNRWYLVGQDDADGYIKSFCLDRIDSVEPNAGVRFIEAGFNPADFYKHTIGIISPQTKPPLIRLAFSREQAPYILAQPIHWSQKVVNERKDGVVISVQLHPTYEFESLVLGWRDDVEVLSPKSLRTRLRELISSMFDQYS